MGRRAFRAVGASESLQRRLSHERPHHQDGKNREQDIQRTSKEDAVRDAEIACRSIFHDYDKNEIRAMPTSVRMAWQAGAQLVADEAAAPVSAPSVMLVDGGSWDLRGKQAMKAEERADKAERELAEIRDALAGTDYASLPSDFPTVRMAHTIRADHDKFLQQVRDTCGRAEKAEAMSKGTAAETESNAKLAERPTDNVPAASMSPPAVPSEEWLALARARMAVHDRYVNRCAHEWYQGRCIHCDVAARDGKPAA